MLSTVLMTFAPGCLNTTRKMLRLPLLQPAWVVVGRARRRPDADVAHAHRRAVAIGDDDVVPGLGFGQLIVVVDREGLLVADDRALGAVDRGDGDLRAHVLELQVLFDELGGIDLDADRRLLLAADAHQRHAGDLADALRQDVLGGVVDVDDRRDVGLDGEDQDRRVGRIDLAIGRRARAGSSATGRRRR